jgi:glutathione peroxidase
MAWASRCFQKYGSRAGRWHPLYWFLTEKETNPRFAGAISWNFAKFLIGRDGSILARFRSQDEPQSAALRAAVEAALGS